TRILWARFSRCQRTCLHKTCAFIHTLRSCIPIAHLLHRILVCLLALLAKIYGRCRPSYRIILLIPRNIFMMRSMSRHFRLNHLAAVFALLLMFAAWPGNSLAQQQTTTTEPASPPSLVRPTVLTRPL